MTQKEPINHHLADLFGTALAGLKPPPVEPAQIVVNGSHNVLSWGGTVYVRDDAPARRGESP